MVNCPISFDKILQNLFWPKSQQIFALMKTSFAFVSRRRLQDVLIKTNIFTLFIRLQKTSWRHLHQDQHISLSHTSSRPLQDVFKTYQVKLFLVAQFQDVFETYSKRFWDVLLRRLSTGGLPRWHFWEIYGQCTKFPRVIKISQVLIFHFTTPFSGYTLQRRI